MYHLHYAAERTHKCWKCNTVEVFICSLWLYDIQTKWSNQKIIMSIMRLINTYFLEWRPFSRCLPSWKSSPNWYSYPSSWLVKSTDQRPWPIAPYENNTTTCRKDLNQIVVTWLRLGGTARACETLWCVAWKATFRNLRPDVRHSFQNFSVS